MNGPAIPRRPAAHLARWALLLALGGVVAGTQPAAAVPPGPRTTAVIMVNFTNASAPWGADQVRAAVFTGPNSANAFLREQSFGAISLRGRNAADGDILGPVTIGAPTGCTPDSWEQAAGAGLDLSGYQHRIYIFPSVSLCPWLGLADVSGGTSFINGTLSTRVIAHELGHNLGSYHASSLRCADGTATVVISPTCTQSEYGDPFDVMGNSSKHQSALSKVQLGFIGAASEATVTRSGRYALASSSGATAAAPQSLRIRRGTTTDYWYFELRSPAGVFESFLATDPAVTGVSIRLSRPTPSRTLLVDASPATGGSSGFTDAPLAVGASFVDTATPGSPTVTVDSVAAGVANVRIEFPGDPLPPPGTPSPTPAPGTAGTNGAVPRARVIVRRLDRRRGLVRVILPVVTPGRCSARIGSVKWIRCPVTSDVAVATRGFRVRNATVAVAIRFDKTVFLNRRFRIPTPGAKQRVVSVPVRIAG